MTATFDQPLRLDQIRDGDRVELDASEAERRRVADRIGVTAVHRLGAHAALERTGETIRARGRLQAAVEQSCVATGEPVESRIDEPFELLFVADPGSRKADEEIELSAQDCDVVFHDGATIDLGEAIADTLALSIDPYPRSAGAEAALKDAGVLSEEEAGPFAALAALKKQLGGNDS